MFNYLEKAKQYAKEKWPNDEIAEGWVHFDIMDFAKWLDSQKNKETKPREKIKRLDITQSVGKDSIVYYYENRSKINEIIDFLNAEKSGEKELELLKIRERERQERLDCPSCNPNTPYGAGPEFFDQWRIKHEYHKNAEK